MDRIRLYSLDLLAQIESGRVSTRKELGEEKFRLCSKYGLSGMPSNASILSFAGKKSGEVIRLLKVKPTRSLSGISVVAIMSRPHDCPGRCIYCPGSLLPGVDTPKSYTGREPAAMRAVSFGFNPRMQVFNRLKQLEEAGHSTGKLELIVMGGTFLSHPAGYQERFMLSAINALAGSREKTLAGAKKAAEKSGRRVAGITFETRPDFCGQGDVDRMLSFGGTRCELGVQTVYDRVYEKINRGHSVKDVSDATRLLKDSAFKVTYHYMPGLPGVSFSEDKKAIRKLFSDGSFKPDNLKVYPCLVIKGTKLYDMWKRGDYEPFSTEKAVRLLSSVKENVPRWVRIMRIQRDIPAQLISAGVKKSNLRQLVQSDLHARGKKCVCIRCREFGLLSRGELPAFGDACFFVEEYEASLGREFFVSLEDKKRACLFGFVRVRVPHSPFRKEIPEGSALVRELRVFGLPLPLHERDEMALQHRGFGRALLGKAEELAVDEACAKKLVVISGLGVKPYYRSLGFKNDGAFVSKSL